MPWQTMESAPKEHGQRVLLFVPKTNKGVVIGRWQARLVTHSQTITGWWLEGFDLCFNEEPYLPTLWQPLPEVSSEPKD